MRVKDDNKKDAIFEATIELLNEIGFANITMAKIGKLAGVSSSTIYVYFDNKEDMLKKVYLDVKEKLSVAMSKDIYDGISIHSAVEQLVRNVLTFVLDHQQYFLFIEQFSNSPLVSDVEEEKIDRLFLPLYKVFEKGIGQKELKKADTSLLIVYCYQPAVQVAKALLKRGAKITEDEIKLIIQMSWDAIRAQA
jgi:AcrR family transcriptional regulator